MGRWAILNPLICGRDWPSDIRPGFGVDPVLAGVAMRETIQGIQDMGVIACAKHYVMNEQERMPLFSLGDEEGQKTDPKQTIETSFTPMLTTRQCMSSISGK